MRTLPALLLLLLPSAAPAAETPFYVGTWDCEVSTFTFTETTYDPGEAPLAIRSVTRDGENAYTLAFDDGYAIGVSRIDGQSMQWLSHASGDMFTCKRLP
ncbi:hypothetical protein [Ensifer soli]|uniref:hypothetical protein n=1 Tax=Ciceribacter sp. sgz301302 TaxID=3342379 RepID=UPI0035B9D7A6